MEIQNDFSNLKVISHNTKKNLDDKKKLYDNQKLKKDERNILNNITYNNLLLNINSAYRNKIPKNIFTTNNDILSNNTINVTRNSNIVGISYPNHKFNINDTIIVQNVVSYDNILTNSVYFFTNFPYMFINYVNHNISPDYLNFYDNNQIKIDIISNLQQKTFYYNIPINYITGLFQIHLPSIVNKTVSFLPIILNTLNVKSVSELDSNYILIDLQKNFICTSNYYIPPDIFKFNILNIGGIPLSFINADYPIDYTRNQYCQIITNIDQNNIYFTSPITASSTASGGGNNVQIMLITGTIDGYQYCNSYSIDLKRTFNNVVRIELISTEIPYTNFIITSNVNNYIYWKIIEDGSHIYSAAIPEGNYDASNLISQIITTLNNTKRIISTPEDLVYNIFNVTVNQYSQEIIFYSYQIVNLPNSINGRLVTINNIQYLEITISLPNILLDVGDTIIIINTSETSSLINSLLVNTKLTVYSVNYETNSFTILLSLFFFNSATINSLNSNNIFSGNANLNIQLQIPLKFSLLFNYPNTIGPILGFSNAGQPNSITPYKSMISNFDQYIQSTNTNSVGDIIINNNLSNFSGNYLYILMYINDFKCIINNSDQPDCFAKIYLAGNPGDVLFNTFVNFPLEFVIPLVSLSKLDIKFTYPDGSLVDFKNIDHSFTLRIIEKIEIPYNTGLNSKDSSYYLETLNN